MLKISWFDVVCNSDDPTASAAMGKRNPKRSKEEISADGEDRAAPRRGRSLCGPKKKKKKIGYAEEKSKDRRACGVGFSFDAPKD